MFRYHSRILERGVDGLLLGLLLYDHRHPSVTPIDPASSRAIRRTSVSPERRPSSPFPHTHCVARTRTRSPRCRTTPPKPRTSCPRRRRSSRCVDARPASARDTRGGDGGERRRGGSVRRGRAVGGAGKVRHHDGDGVGVQPDGSGRSRSRSRGRRGIGGGPSDSRRARRRGVSGGDRGGGGAPGWRRTSPGDSCTLWCCFCQF